MSEDIGKLPPESDQIEYKKSFQPQRCFETLCAFANTKGGSLYIGIKNDTTVVGITDSKLDELHRKLPGQIRDILGIVAEVTTENRGKKQTLCIKVLPVNFAVKYDRTYYKRSGEHDFALKGEALEDFLQRKPSIWDGHLLENVSISSLDDNSKNRFLKLAKKNGEYLPQEFNSLLKKMELVENNKLKKAAVLLFHLIPRQHLFVKAYIEIEYTSKHSISNKKYINGNLLTQIDETVKSLLDELLKTPKDNLNRKKNKKKSISNITVSEQKKLREAVCAALILKDYSAKAPIKIKISKREFRFIIPSLNFKNSTSQNQESTKFILNKDHLQKEKQSAFINEMRKSAFFSINSNLSRAFKKIGFDIEEWINASCSPAIAELDFGVWDKMFQINFERDRTNKNLINKIKSIRINLKQPIVIFMAMFVVFLFSVGFVWIRFDNIDDSINKLSDSIVTKKDMEPFEKLIQIISKSPEQENSEDINLPQMRPFTEPERKLSPKPERDKPKYDKLLKDITEATNIPKNSTKEKN